MSHSIETVYVLDDEPGMVKALTRLLRTEGFEVQGFTSPARFLEAFRPGSLSCLVLDVFMPELDGLDLQKRLTHGGILVPIVFLTGHGDIPMSVRAMKGGAVDFLTKPVNDADLLRAVRAALARAAAQRETAAISVRLTRLTPREREVMEQVITGKLNKQIATDLGTGEQNIKIHRARVMRKMGTESVAELVRVAERLGIGRNGAPDPEPKGLCFLVSVRNGCTEIAMTDEPHDDKPRLRDEVLQLPSRLYLSIIPRQLHAVPSSAAGGRSTNPTN